jgi:hypothetical protein
MRIHIQQRASNVDTISYKPMKKKTDIFGKNILLDLDYMTLEVFMAVNTKIAVCGMWFHVICWTGTDISNEIVVSNFREG